MSRYYQVVVEVVVTVDADTEELARETAFDHINNAGYEVDATWVKSEGE